MPLITVRLVEYRTHGTIEKLRVFFPKAVIVCEPNGWDATITMPDRQMDLLKMFEATQVRLGARPWHAMEVQDETND
jgi:hypothetical protein